MNPPPVQYTMDNHVAETISNKKPYLRAAIAGLIVLIFATAVAFSTEYFNQTPPVPQAQSASAAEIFDSKDYFSNVSLLAQGAIVADIDTGTVVYQNNADIQLPLASLTKVPLVLAASEVLAPETIITIGHDTSYNSKASQLLAGERWRAGDLISYTLVASSNDGAQILADAADEPLRAKYQGSAGTISRMNDLVKSLGLSETYFLNTTGLDISPTQSGAYGSARDMARLFAYASKSAPELFAKTATSSIRIFSLDGKSAYAQNTDEALDEIPGMIMGKTGLTDLAGGNLAVVFVANGKRYVAVVLGSTEQGRFSDIQQLTAATRAIGS